MARVTIEGQWWTDPRREQLGGLLGSLLLADAWAIRLWKLSQEFWGRGRKPIPLGIFEALEAAPNLIKAGLVRVEADGIYVKGSRDFVDWLNGKRASAKAGGKKSASSRKKKYGTAQPNPEANTKQDRSTDEANSSNVEPSGSGTVSGSGGKIPKTSSSGESLPAIAKGKNSVALWMEAYYRKYKLRYPALGKDTGTLVNLEKSFSGPQLEVLFAAYLAMKVPLYEEQSHPLSLFFRDLPKISKAAWTGIDPSQKPEEDWEREAREAEERKQHGS